MRGTSVSDMTKLISDPAPGNVHGSKSSRRLSRRASFPSCTRLSSIKVLHSTAPTLRAATQELPTVSGSVILQNFLKYGDTPTSMDSPTTLRTRFHSRSMSWIHGVSSPIPCIPSMLFLIPGGMCYSYTTHRSIVRTNPQPTTLTRLPAFAWRCVLVNSAYLSYQSFRRLWQQTQRILSPLRPAAQ